MKRSLIWLLAIVVAFIGVLSALMSLQLERSRELGVLRATGMTLRQLWALTFIETGLMGGVAGLLAIPVGYALAWILIYVTNVRSFGWTLNMQLQPSNFLQAVAVAIEQRSQPMSGRNTGKPDPIHPRIKIFFD